MEVSVGQPTFAVAMQNGDIATLHIRGHLLVSVVDDSFPGNGGFIPAAHIALLVLL